MDARRTKRIHNTTSTGAVNSTSRAMPTGTRLNATKYSQNVIPIPTTPISALTAT